MNSQLGLRSDIYLLLATLLRQAPEQPLLNLLSGLDIQPTHPPLYQAWQLLKARSAQIDAATIQQEYQDLFIGIGRGEALPFASWHLTGFLMEKPLALLRQDLQALGFARQDDVKEPEDHIAALCEVMAYLCEDNAEDLTQQQTFFQRHIACWFEPLGEQITNAKSAQFYQAVNALMMAFLRLEQVRLTINPGVNQAGQRVTVKNIQHYQ